MQQARLSGRSTTLEQKRSYRSRFRPQTVFFLGISALLEVRSCLKLQSCAISRKTYGETLISFRTQFGALKLNTS